MAGQVVGSVENIVAQLGIAGGRIRKVINDAIAEEAKGVQQVARAMVPLERGDMTRAIKVTSGSQRRLWTIYIDENMPADGPKKGEIGRYTVGDYLTFLHESTYNLGPLSVAKQSTTPYTVGRKFLDRAFEERMRSGMMKRIEAAARQAGVLS